MARVPKTYLPCRCEPSLCSGRKNTSTAATMTLKRFFHIRFLSSEALANEMIKTRRYREVNRGWHLSRASPWPWLWLQSVGRKSIQLKTHTCMSLLSKALKNKNKSSSCSLVEAVRVRVVGMHCENDVNKPLQHGAECENSLTCVTPHNCQPVSSSTSVTLPYDMSGCSRSDTCCTPPSARGVLNRFLPMENSVCENFAPCPPKLDINSPLFLQMSASTHSAPSNTSDASDNTKTKLFLSPWRRKVFASQKFKLLNRWIGEEDLFHPKIKSNNEKQNQPWESSLMCSHTHHRTAAVWSRGKKRASSEYPKR